MCCEINSFDASQRSPERARGRKTEYWKRENREGISPPHPDLRLSRLSRLCSANTSYLTTWRHRAIEYVTLTIRETTKSYLSEPNTSCAFLIVISSTSIFFVLSLFWSRDIMEKTNRFHFFFSTWMQFALTKSFYSVRKMKRKGCYKILSVNSAFASPDVKLFALRNCDFFSSLRVSSTHTSCFGLCLFHRVKRIASRCIARADVVDEPFHDGCPSFQVRVKKFALREEGSAFIRILCVWRIPEGLFFARANF